MLKLRVKIKAFYEKYHRTRNIQNNVIGENDFTYKNIISVINKYLKEGDSILDVGCGVGSICIYLASKGYKVTGVDISGRAIKTARTSARNLLNKNIPDFKIADISKFRIKNNASVVLMMEILEHLKEDKKIFKSIAKSLPKDGLVICSSPTSNAPLYRMGLLKQFDNDVGHLRRYSSREFKKMFMDSRFKIIDEIKTEGLIRSLLFTNNQAGKLIRYLKWPISAFVLFLDNLTVKIFGESDIIIVAQKK